MIPWQPHTKHPADHGATAILGIRTGNVVEPGRGWMIVPGIYYWHAERGEWLSEQSGHRLTYRQYWYCLESDLLAHLSAQAHSAGNGHGVQS